MNIPSRYHQMGERSRKSILNIISSFGAKGVTVLITLLIVPLTINYVNPTRYGIWLTLSSIIGWISFFDLGLGNGLRNKFAEAKAEGNIELARQYVSTTYFTIGGIVLALLIIIELLNILLDWSSILKVDISYNTELREVFAILTAFFCVNMIVRLFTSVLTADQRPGIASWIGAIGQVFSLLVIYVLTKISEGSLVKLAAFYAGIPTVVLLLASCIAYRFTSYKQYTPSIKFVKRSLVNNIMGLGLQFFVIYLCMLVIFQIVNIVISRELGPDSVTEYNIAYKFFNVAHSVMVIIITPFWSAFTDAYHKDDISWMKKVKRVLELIWICELIGLVIMVFISQWFYNFWIGSDVIVGGFVSLAMAIYIGIQGIGTAYMNLINGIGTIRLQLVIYVIFALVALPLMTYACRFYGLVGILIAPSLAYLFQAIVANIQLNKLLDKKASGIWVK